MTDATSRYAHRRAVTNHKKSRSVKEMQTSKNVVSRGRGPLSRGPSRRSAAFKLMTQSHNDDNRSEFNKDAEDKRAALLRQQLQDNSVSIMKIQQRTHLMQKMRKSAQESTWPSTKFTSFRGTNNHS